jgi:hypothetical protein
MRVRDGQSPGGPPVGSERTQPMHLRILLILTTLAAMAASVAATSAGAATLFTTAAHTGHVPTGTTAGISSSTVRLTSGTSGSTVESCADSTLNLTIVQNSGAKVVASVSGGNFTTCAQFPTVTPTFGGTSTLWTLTISGAGTVSGTRTRWTAGVDSVSFDFGNGNYRGSFSSRVTAYQPTAVGSPVCVEFASSGSVVGPLTGDGRLDATYCFEALASAFSLTN